MIACPRRDLLKTFSGNENVQSVFESDIKSIAINQQLALVIGLVHTHSCIHSNRSNFKVTSEFEGIYMCHFLFQFQNLMCQYIKFKNKCIWQGNCSRIKLYANNIGRLSFVTFRDLLFAIFPCGKRGRLEIIANQSDAFNL